MLLDLLNTLQNLSADGFLCGHVRSQSRSPSARWASTGRVTVWKQYETLQEVGQAWETYNTYSFPSIAQNVEKARWHMYAHVNKYLKKWKKNEEMRRGRMTNSSCEQERTANMFESWRKTAVSEICFLPYFIVEAQAIQQETEPQPKLCGTAKCKKTQTSSPYLAVR